MMKDIGRHFFVGGTRGRRKPLAASLVALVVTGAMLSGCAVPQRRGAGKELHLREPQTKAWYWLYLPEDYVTEHKDAKVTTKKYPLVMTFHGMKPFDTARAQCREWQQEADRYGFVVCAPQLTAPDLSSPVPLKTITPALQGDEKAILTIMDEVMRTTDVNPSAVLATSWSYGGYVAHYMMNRHPSRFTCLAVKQSNFSADILDPKQVDQYRDKKIAVFYTENDFDICQRESQEAALWYSRLGFDLTFREFSRRGHERTPSLAAAFFARDCGVEPNSPPTELAHLQVRDVPLLDRTDGKVNGVTPPAAGGDSGEFYSPSSTSAANPLPPSQPKADGPERTTLASAGYNIYNDPKAPGRNLTVSEPPPPGVGARSTGDGPNDLLFTKPVDSASPIRTRPATPAALPPSSAATRRGARSGESEAAKTTPPPTAATSPVRVRLSSTIGIAPLLVSYSAAVPNRLKDNGYFLWTDNGEPMSNGINGQKFFTDPGDHEIEVLVTTQDGQEYRASSTVTVLERINRANAQ